MEGQQDALKLVEQRVIHLSLESFKAAEAGDIALINSDLNPSVEINKAKNEMRVALAYVAKTQQNGSDLFELKISYQGSFSFAANLTDDQLTGFASANAPAVIYPLLRSVVAMVTVSAGYPPLTLPILNFHKIKTGVRFI